MENDNNKKNKINKIKRSTNQTLTKHKQGIPQKHNKIKAIQNKVKAKQNQNKHINTKQKHHETQQSQSKTKQIQNKRINTKQKHNKAKQKRIWKKNIPDRLLLFDVLTTTPARADDINTTLTDLLSEAFAWLLKWDGFSHAELNSRIKIIAFVFPGPHTVSMDSIVAAP